MSASKFLYTVLAALIFGAGYAFADALRTADIQRLKADYAQAAQEYQAKLTKREADNAKKLADAVDKKQAEIDALGSQLAGMRDDVKRLRRAASAGGGGVPPAPVVPASLVSDKSETVSAYLRRVRSFLVKAADWSAASAQTETPSAKP